MKICNNCPQLSLTEEEQNRLHLSGIEKPHMCRKYNQRVFHKTNKPNHEPTIYPCSECEGGI